MSFSEHADARIKAALESVVTQSVAAGQQELDTLRAAVEARYDACAASLAATYESASVVMRAELLADLVGLAEEEARVAADAARREALEQAQRQLETERLAMRDHLEAVQSEARAQLEAERAARREALATARADARADMEAAQAALRGELEAETAEKMGTLTEALDGAQVEVLRLRTQVQTQLEASLVHVEAARAEAKAARAETMALTDMQGERETILAELRAQLESARTTKATLSKELEQVRVEVERAREDAEAARHNARTQGLQALAHVAAVKSEGRTERADSTAETPEDWVEVFPGKEKPTIESTPARVRGPSADGLLDACLTIDAANSLGEVLNALLEHLAVEFSRAALFVVQDDRLHEWRSVGFDGSATGLERFEAPLTADSLLTRAVLHRQPMASDDRLTTSRGSSRAGVQPAMAFPICIADSVVAVAYAVSGQPTGNDQARAPRVQVAESLVSHAARRLTTLLATSRTIPATAARPGW